MILKNKKHSSIFNFIFTAFLASSLISCDDSTSDNFDPSKKEHIAFQLVDYKGEKATDIYRNRSENLFVTLESKPTFKLGDLKVDIVETSCADVSTESVSLYRVNELLESPEGNQQEMFLSNYGHNDPLTITVSEDCEAGQFVVIEMVGKGVQANGLEIENRSTMYLEIKNDHLDESPVEFLSYSLNKVKDRNSIVYGEEFEIEFALKNTSGLPVSDLQVGVNVSGGVLEAFRQGEFVNFSGVSAYAVADNEHLANGQVFTYKIPFTFRAAAKDLEANGPVTADNDEIVTVVEKSVYFEVVWQNQGTLGRKVLDIPLADGVSLEIVDVMTYNPEDFKNPDSLASEESTMIQEMINEKYGQQKELQIVDFKVKITNNTAAKTSPGLLEITSVKDAFIHESSHQYRFGALFPGESLIVPFNYLQIIPDNENARRVIEVTMGWQTQKSSGFNKWYLKSKRERVKIDGKDVSRFVWRLDD